MTQLQEFLQDAAASEKTYAGLLEYQLRRMSKQDFFSAILDESQKLSQALDIEGLRFAEAFSDHLNSRFLNTRDESRKLWAANCNEAFKIMIEEAVDCASEEGFEELTDALEEGLETLTVSIPDEHASMLQDVLFGVFQIATLHFAYSALQDRRFRDFVGIRTSFWPSRTIRHVLSWVLSLYVLGSCVAGIYFNWQYAREHGVMKWVAFGELYATLKGLGWPYFLYDTLNTQSVAHVSRKEIASWPIQARPPSQNTEQLRYRAEVDKFSKCIHGMNELFERIQAAYEQRQNPDSSPDFSLQHLEAALSSCAVLDNAVLLKIDVDLPVKMAIWHEGWKMIFQGVASGDAERMRAGLALIATWIEWWNANYERIGKRMDAIRSAK